ncbi:MAG: hypothetical protein KF912_11505 [Phycisphaeraceae bacterium]|nr:hypothetical protein [Phycisphaeraceae bacterium]MBX3367927.1 hypothetical protein [Phycisphaeraceae bacterium]
MTREERDYFDEQRYRQFRHSLIIGGACMLACLCALLVFMMRGDTERVVLICLGAASLYAFVVAISLWRVRQPGNRWPNRLGMAFGVVPGVVMVSSSKPTLIGFLTGTLPLLVAVAGGIVVIGSVLRRRGAKEFCAACVYEKGEGAGERCPECGTRWHKPGATIRGERVASIPGIAAGVLVLAAGVALLWASSRFRAEILDVMPRGALLSHLIHTNSVDRDLVVARLATMEIPADEAQRASERILRVRARSMNGVASQAAMDWLVSQWLAGAIDDPMMERYARESAELSLRLSGGAAGGAVEGAAAQTGIPVTIEVACVSRFSGQRHKVVVAIESLTLEEEHDGEFGAGQTLLGPAASTQYPNLIDSPMFPQYAIVTTFTPATPGRKRATLAYWLFVTDGQPGDLTWSVSDGVAAPIMGPAPGRASSSGIWSKRFTTTLDLHVHP